MNNIIIRITLIFSIFFLFSIHTFAGIDYYQNTKINNDGSVTVYISYSAPISEVTKNSNVIGNFPFTAESLREYFGFPNIDIKKATVYKDPQNQNNYRAAFEFQTKSVSKISDAKSFTGIEASLVSSDTGLVFSWQMPAEYIESNSITTYNFTVAAEPEIKSSNGYLKDKEVYWFVFGDKIDSRGYVFFTTLNSDLKITSTEEDNGSNPNDKKNTGCGLFAFELPAILLFGLALSYRLKKQNTF